MKKKPKPRSIVKEEKGAYGTTIWTLKNQAKVIIKQTPFNDGFMTMFARRQGGMLSQLIKAKDPNYYWFGDLMNSGGLADYTNAQVEKLQVGHIASATPNIDFLNDYIEGGCLSDDLELMLQKVYLQIKDKRWSKEDFIANKDKIFYEQEAKRENPQESVGDSMQRLLQPELYELKWKNRFNYYALKLSKIKKLYKKAFSGVRDFNFVFVGDIDTAKLRPLVERYIASLPKGHKRPTNAENLCKYTLQGEHKFHYSRPMKQNIALVVNHIPIQVEANMYNVQSLNLLAKIIYPRLFQKIREEESKVYGLGVTPQIEPFHYGELVLQIAYWTAPKNAEGLNQMVRTELDKLAKEGIIEREFRTALYQLVEEHKTELKTNEYWYDILSRYYSPDSYYKERPELYASTLRSITKESLQQFLKQMLAPKNFLELILSSKPLQLF